jgi:hypothetical protein
MSAYSMSAGCRLNVSHHKPLLLESQGGRRLVATSAWLPSWGETSKQASKLVSGLRPNKRPYTKDFETFLGYFSLQNIAMKILTIVVEPCNKSLSRIMAYMKDEMELLENMKAMGMTKNAKKQVDLSFEDEWAKNWPETRQAIIDTLYKTICIDVIKKIYDYSASACFSVRMTDRLTKLVQLSSQRKLERYGYSVSDRAYVSMLLLKTTAYALAVGKLSVVTYEVLNGMYLANKRKKGAKDSRLVVREVAQLTARNVSRVGLQYAFQIVTVSVGCAFDWLSSLSDGYLTGLGFAIGSGVGEGLAEEVSRLAWGGAGDDGEASDRKYGPLS